MRHAFSDAALNLTLKLLKKIRRGLHVLISETMDKIFLSFDYNCIFRFKSHYINILCHGSSTDLHIIIYIVLFDLGSG